MNIFEIPIHQAANAFHMFDEERMQQLVDDIKARGLDDPIVIQKVNGVVMLVDGRNRREACKRAGIEPKYVQLDDNTDTAAYIFSHGMLRRDNTAGQRALAHAMIYPKEKGGRGNKGAAITAGLHRDSISRARYLLAERHQALREKVFVGGMTLNAAYTTAKEMDDDLAQWEADYEWLRVEAPEYARRVKEDGKSVAEAKREFQESEEQKRVERAGFWKILEDMEKYASTFTEDGKERLSGYIREHGEDECQIDIESLAKQLTAISKYLGEQKNGN